VPADKKRIDIGSFYSDSSRLRRTVGWEPAIGLREGLARTVAYYRAHLAEYVAPGAPGAVTP
jgi:nucleoside-diphosphate-sugar epimerase